MDERFRRYVESLHPSFQRLVDASPVTGRSLPRGRPLRCVYLFSERGKHLYVGRTRKLPQRMRQHCLKGSQHNQAVFAFKLAREECGKIVATYTTNGSRATLCADPAFADAFDRAKQRVSMMELRYVEEADPTRQALLELYVAIALATPYNDFDTH